MISKGHTKSFKKSFCSQLFENKEIKRFPQINDISGQNLTGRFLSEAGWIWTHCRPRIDGWREESGPVPAFREGPFSGARRLLLKD
jgi:hypothetical protein